MDRYKFYKNREGVDGRNARKQCITDARKERRMQRLEELRNIEVEDTAKPPIVTEKKKKSRLELLKEWKLEKAQKENLAKLAKKPPFYAGKIQTKATGSPLLALTAAPLASTRSGPVTRAQTKANNIRIIKPLQTVPKRRQQEPKTMKLEQLNKVEKDVLKPIGNHKFVVPKAVRDLTVPQSPKIRKSARKSVRPLFDSIKKESEMNSMVCNHLNEDELKAPKAKRMLLNTDSMATETFSQSTKPSPIFEISQTTESMDTGPVTIQEKNEKIEYSPDQSPRPFNNFQHLTFSPFVEKGRGSSTNRRSSKKSISLNERIDAEIKEEENIFNAKIASFRLFLTNETSRLLGLAETWVHYLQNQPDLSSDVEGDINAVAGKTKLLTSDKFKQFEDLINKCEAGDPMIKVDDLQGYHDWVSLEIEDLDKVFSKLEERKQNGWVVVEAPKARKVIKKRPSKTAPAKNNANSKIRAFIMDAQTHLRAQSKVLPAPVPEENPIPPASPKIIGTPRDQKSLRIEVLRRCSGLAILAATSMARLSLSPSKSPDPTSHVLDPSLNLTPSKSILKKTDAPLSEKKNVIFGGMDPKYLLPAEDSSFDFDLPTTPPTATISCPELNEEPSQSKTFLSYTPEPASLLKNCILDKKYLLPAEDSSDESPVGLCLVEDDVAPQNTPLRRSCRIARKSKA